GLRQADYRNQATITRTIRGIAHFPHPGVRFTESGVRFASNRTAPAPPALSPLAGGHRMFTSRAHCLAIAIGFSVALFASPGCSSLPAIGNGNFLTGDSAQGTGGRGPEAPSAQPTPTEIANQTDDAVRAIEEADIVKVVDNSIYALNQYKGLLVIDAT